MRTFYILLRNFSIQTRKHANSETKEIKIRCRLLACMHRQANTHTHTQVWSCFCTCSTFQMVWLSLNVSTRKQTGGPWIFRVKTFTDSRRTLTVSPLARSNATGRRERINKQSEFFQSTPIAAREPRENFLKLLHGANGTGFVKEKSS